MPIGHEYVGIVEEVGSAVRNFKPGQFVVGSFFASDNTCEICRAGYHSSCIHCPPGAPTGVQAQYARLPLADGKLVATPDIPLDDLIAQTIRKAHAVQPVTAIQNEYSLWWRLPEEAVLPTCEELGTGFVPYSPLGKGFLTGKIDENTTFKDSDLRSRIPRFDLENRKVNRALVNLLKNIAEQKQATPTQIALAWLLAQKPWSVPIPGTTKLSRFEENIGAVNVELTTDDVHEIESAASKITIQGARYPEELDRMTGL